MNERAKKIKEICQQMLRDTPEISVFQEKIAKFDPIQGKKNLGDIGKLNFSAIQRLMMEFDETLNKPQIGRLVYGETYPPRSWKYYVLFAFMTKANITTTQKLLQAAKLPSLADLYVNLRSGDKEKWEDIFEFWKKHLSHLRTISYRRPDFYVGHQSEMEALKETLFPGKVVAIVGCGGIGKTAFATETLWRLLEAGELFERFPGGVFWHDFYSQSSLAELCEHLLRFYVYQFGDDNSLEEQAKSALGGRQALLILDGVENLKESLEPIVSPGHECAFLLLSRKRDVPTKDIRELTFLDTSASKELLTKTVGFKSLTEQGEKLILKLVKKLDGHPLALALAATHLRDSLSSIEAIIPELVDPINVLQAPEHRVQIQNRESHKNIKVLLDHTVSKLSDSDRKILELAGQLAFCPIDKEVVESVFPEMSPFRREAAFGVLIDWLLVSESEGQWQVKHALIHEYLSKYQSLPVVSMRVLKEFYQKKVDTFDLSWARQNLRHLHCLSLSPNWLDEWSANIKWETREDARLGEMVANNLRLFLNTLAVYQFHELETCQRVAVNDGFSYQHTLNHLIALLKLNLGDQSSFDNIWSESVDEAFGGNSKDKGLVGLPFSEVVDLILTEIALQIIGKSARFNMLISVPFNANKLLNSVNIQSDSRIEIHKALRQLVRVSFMGMSKNTYDQTLVSVLGRAKNVAVEIEDFLLVAFMLAARGEVNLYLGNLPQARKDFHEAIEVYTSNDYPEHANYLAKRVRNL